jgi:hypothetical protein
MANRKTWLAAVKAVLADNIPARDSDPRLYVAVCITLGQSSTLTLGVAAMLVERGDLPSYEYVSRSRRALQEDFPALRGPKYRIRHKLAEDYRQDVRGTLAGTAAGR